MRVMKPLLTAGETLIDRVLCVVGAVVFSQAPEFMQQYLQRLGGHLAEARRQMAQFEEIARQAGKNVRELAAQYLASADPSVASMGKIVGETQQRVDVLAASEVALRDASLWSRPFVFLRDMDSEIARGTLDVFKPAVPTTAEGFVYALLGVIIILVAYHGIVRPLIGRVWRGPHSTQEMPKRA
jgi:hypothetical protein